MFDRKILKQRAKQTLADSYWNALAMILVVNFAATVLSGIIAFSTTGNVVLNNAMNITVFLLLQLVSTALSVAVSALLTSPLQVGLDKFMLEAAEGKQSSFDCLAYVFRTNYRGITAVLFAKLLIINLLTLIPVVLLNISSYTEYPVFLIIIGYLALIPVFVKSYDYYLVEYILTEKPDISWREALGESKKLMNGNKWAVLKLNFSFFGWILLGMLACGIGLMFVMPYIEATDAQLYMELSGKNNIEIETEL